MKTIGVRVTVVVEHEGKILLIREKNGKGEACYSLPGGHVEHLESIAAATQREVQEETGLLVAIERLLWVDERIERSGEGKHTIGVAVQAKLIGEQTVPAAQGLVDEEIEWAGWVSYEEWKALPLHSSVSREQVIQALTNAAYIPDYLGNMLERKGR